MTTMLITSKQISEHCPFHDEGDGGYGAHCNLKEMGYVKKDDDGSDGCNRFCPLVDMVIIVDKVNRD